MELDLLRSNFNRIFSTFIKEKDADKYVFAHATVPFIFVDTMIECIEAVKSGKCASAFCVEKIQTFLWKNGETLNFDAANLPRTQDLEPIYQETSEVYVFKKEVFTMFDRRIGIKAFIKCVGFKETVDIDNPEILNLQRCY